MWHVSCLLPPSFALRASLAAGAVLVWSKLPACAWMPDPSCMLQEQAASQTKREVIPGNFHCCTPSSACWSMHRDELP